MSQTQLLTDEEFKDEVLAVFEENEQAILGSAAKIEKIEAEAEILLDRKIIAIKNKFIDDLSIPDDEIEARCLQEIELEGQKILEDVKKQIEDVVAAQE